jgi:hypothetical protein
MTLCRCAKALPFLDKKRKSMSQALMGRESLLLFPIATAGLSRTGPEILRKLGLIHDSLAVPSRD